MIRSFSKHRDRSVVPNKFRDRLRAPNIHDADRIVGTGDRDQVIPQWACSHQPARLNIHARDDSIAVMLPLHETPIIATGEHELPVL